MTDLLISEFKQRVLDESLDRILQCGEMLTEEQFWKKAGPTTNSVGNLVLHLQGNMTQYILSCLGGQPDQRERSKEFMIQSLPKSEVLGSFRQCALACVDVVRNLDEQEIAKIYQVQCFEMTGVSILVHVIEHLSYHTGQITLLTKLFTEKETGYYEGMELE